MDHLPQQLHAQVALEQVHHLVDTMLQNLDRHQRLLIQKVEDVMLVEAMQKVVQMQLLVQIVIANLEYIYALVVKQSLFQDND